MLQIALSLAKLLSSLVWFSRKAIAFIKLKDGQLNVLEKVRNGSRIIGFSREKLHNSVLLGSLMIVVVWIRSKRIMDKEKT